MNLNNYTWYAFSPQDTLYFRGSEPMDAGEDHISTSVFPPANTTLMGAVRTAYLMQNKLNIEDYVNNKVDNPEVVKANQQIGSAGENPNFELAGPLFKYAEDLLLPAPCNFYIRKSDSKKSANQGEDKVLKSIKIFRSQPINSPLLKTATNSVNWITNEDQFISLAGFWIKAKDLGKDQADLYPLASLVGTEQRTGIKIGAGTGTVLEGYLYSFQHNRFKDKVSLVFGLSKDSILEKEGVLKVGAEQRFGQYNKIEQLNLPQNKIQGNYLSLSLISHHKDLVPHLVATGKPVYLGGWDMKKRFHKPLRGYYNQGTVLNKKFANCLEI